MGLRQSPDMQCGVRTRKLGHSEFLVTEVVGDGRSEGHRRRGDPPRLGQEGKRKLTESSREFPKAFRLAEPVRVAPEGAEHLPGPSTSAFHCLVPSVSPIPCRDGYLK